MTSSGLFQTTNPSKVGSTHNGKHSRLWEQVFFFKSDLILEGGGVAGVGGKNDKASQAVQPPCIRK